MAVINGRRAICKRYHKKIGDCEQSRKYLVKFFSQLKIGKPACNYLLIFDFFAAIAVLESLRR